MSSMPVVRRVISVVGFIVAILLYICAGLVAAEFILRALPPLGASGPDVVLDPEIGYDLAPNKPPRWFLFPHLKEGGYSVWSNEYGCFDEPFPAGTSPFIYFAGGSHGWSLAPFPQTWGSVMQDVTGVRFAKCGVAGTGTWQSLVKAKRNLSGMGTPEAIVVAYYVNDLADDAWILDPAYESARALYPSRYAGCSVDSEPTLFGKIRCYIQKKSKLYMFTLYMSKRVGLPLADWLMKGRTTPYADNALFTSDAHRALNNQSLQSFKELADSEGASLLVVLIPGPWELGTGEENSFNAPAAAFLDSKGIAYLNLYEPLTKAAAQGAVLFWPNDSHFNIEGNRFVGLLVSEYLIEHGLAPATRLPEIKTELKSFDTE